jgi:L-fuculose-phosphate aldolase
MNEYDIKKDIIEVGRRCWLRGWVAANDGNISVRISENEILATATGQSKGFLTPELIVKVDHRGNLLEGKTKPSSEIQMHLLVYEERPEIRAVFHAHPPYCTAHAVAGIPLRDCVLPEIVVTLGEIPLAEYGTPSTEEVPQSLLPHLRNHDAFLLENHGALTLGKNLFEAYYRMESIEHFAHIIYLARGLGSVNLLTQTQVEKLSQIRSRYGLQDEVPMCRVRGFTEDASAEKANAPPAVTGETCPPCATDQATEELVDKITSRILEKLRQQRS